MTKKPSLIEPGVLKIMRLGTAIELAIVTIFICLDLLEIDILHYDIQQLMPLLVIGCLLLIYLYIPFLLKLSANIYAVFPIVASTYLAMVFPNILLQMKGPDAFVKSIWLLVPFLAIPLCMVASQFSIWVVGGYVILVNVVQIGIHFSLANQYAHMHPFAIYDLGNAVMLRTVSIFFIGYIISTIVNSRRHYEAKLININHQMDVLNHELEERVEERTLQLQNAYGKTLLGWVKVLELRDFETEGHCERVSILTAHLAARFNYENENMQYVLTGALLHDIGKLNIPDHILLKPGKLDEEEWQIMRTHSDHGYQMLNQIHLLRPCLDIVRYHHERWDGAGYPRGLAGVAIPFSARLFSIVDVWDALTNDRPYRPAWSNSRAKAYIKEQSGTHFDPTVASTFLDMVDNSQTELEQLSLPIQRMVTALY